MAVSFSASTILCLSSDSYNRLACFSSSSRYSSLRFPLRLPLSPTRFRSPTPTPTRSPSLPLVKAKKQTFGSFDDLLANSDKPVLVDFYATWCGPCQFMVPILNEVSATLSDKVQVVKIDTEKYPAIADKYKIEALPTFIVFKHGKPCDRFEGAMNAAQLIQRIEDALKIKQ